MNVPAGVIGAAFVLWGWANGALAPGLVLGLLYEAVRFAPRGAGELALAHAARVARASILGACALLAYTLATMSAPASIYAWLRWLPLALWPLLVLARLAPLGPAVFVQALGRRPRNDDADDEPVEVAPLGLALTLAAAGTGTGAGSWLYAGFASILGWALLARAGRERLGAALAMLVLATALGYAIQGSLYSLQGWLEDLGGELLAGSSGDSTDPFREHTRIGELGRVKLDDRIVMRVTADDNRGTLLLRQAAFSSWRNGVWSNAHRASRPALNGAGRWVLAEGAALHRVQVRGTLPGGEGVLALPAATRAIEGLAADSVEVAANGAVLVHGSASRLDYTAMWDEAGERDAPDSAADLEVPETLAPMLERAVLSGRLRQLTAAASVEAVRHYFSSGFSYSLQLGAEGRTLADFMLRDRKGHCEYFASATVLLLRALGIPARYAAGYSVQEYSELEQSFVVRSRHAHAWAQAWVDGRWIAVDTTPARWAEYEQRSARSVLGPAWDALSWLYDRALRAWSSQGNAIVQALAIACIAGVLLGRGRFAWLRRGKRPRVRPDAIARAWQEIESRLARHGHARDPAETPRTWTRRVAATPGTEAWSASLLALAADYYRARFDPGTSPEHIAHFVRAANAWRPLSPDPSPASGRGERSAPGR